jgi:hypothetical protein
MSDCTCGQKFRDAEDFRDHLPCEGPPAVAELRRELADVRALHADVLDCLHAAETLREEAEDELQLERERTDALIIALSRPIYLNDDWQRTVDEALSDIHNARVNEKKP